MTGWPFTWRAFCTRVIDGDTFDAFCDKGMHDYSRQRIRLANINCPEVHGDTKHAGVQATWFTQAWIDEARANAFQCVIFAGDMSFTWPLTLTTRKTDSFDRYVALVYRTGDPLSLNDALLASGNAVPFMVDVVI